MINLIKDLPENVIGFTATGKVTDKDYEEVVIPTVEDYLQSHDDARIVYHTDKSFDGYTSDALWDDTKLGFKHMKNWRKIAVVTDSEWLENATKLLQFTIPGKVRVFKQGELGEAIEWARD
jgi:hypothetical protein